MSDSPVTTFTIPPAPDAERPMAPQESWDYVMDVLASQGVHWQFWTCADATHRYVDWDGDTATCRECGASKRTQAAEGDETR